MSQALWIKLAELERRIAEIEARQTPTDARGFCAVHKGRGRFIVEQDGVTISNEYMNKTEAEQMVQELTAATSELELA